MFVLQEGEEVVKTWEYGTRKEKGFGGDKVTMSVTATTRRLIHMEDGKRSYAQSEVPIEKIQSIDGACGTKKRIWLLILGVPFCMGLFTLLIGVPLILLYIRGSSTIDFHVRLAGDASDGIDLTSNSTPSKKKKKARKIKVKLDYETAKKMFSEIGAVVYGLQKK